MRRTLLASAALLVLGLAACGERNTPPAQDIAEIEAASEMEPAAEDARSGETSAPSAGDAGVDTAAVAPGGSRAIASGESAGRPRARPASASGRRAAEPSQTGSRGAAARDGGYARVGQSDPYRYDAVPAVEVRSGRRPMTAAEEQALNRSRLSPGGASSGPTAPPNRDAPIP